MLLREKNKISYIHFILSVLVILIHSINNETKFQSLFSIDKGIGQFAVPLFFIISGFLYFRNLSTFDQLLNKLKNRIYTVFVPYILWNLIYYLLHKLLKPGDGFSFIELYDAVFNYAYNPSFWFICQLLLLFLISPLIFLCIDKMWKLWALIVAMSLLVAFNIDIPYINEDAIIYFVIGVIFVKLYNKSKIFLIEKKYSIILLVATIIMMVINRLLLRAVNFGYVPVSIFTLSVIYVRVITAFFIFYFCDLLFSYNDVKSFMNDTFFLYAIHYMIVKAMIIFMRFITYKFLPTSTFVIIETIVFCLSPVVCVIINRYLSDFLKRKVPKAYNLLTGNR